MTRFCLVRHGQTEWNSRHQIQGRVDIPLNDIGRSQSVKASEKLRKLNINWDYVYSSPLKRAYETAQIVCEGSQIKKEIVVLDDLIEREFGELEGGLVGEENYKRMNSKDTKGLEQIEDLEKRSVGVLRKLALSHPDSNILIFTHSQVIKAILLYLDKDFDFTCALDNLSLNFFEVDKDKIRVIKINV